jgi:DNA-binding transcriptional LysR family regulator
MDKLAAMATFVRIVDQGSLTAAARTLDKSLPSVVRSLAALEAALGVRLLNRTTRRIALTLEGRDYLARCRRILGDVEEAELALAAEQSEPAGKLTLSASVLFGQLHVAPLATAFMERYDQVSVDLMLLDRIVNLIEEGVDVAVRIAHLEDSTLIARPVGEVRRVVCASPALIAESNPLTRPEQLGNRDCVHFTGVAPGAAWTFEEGGKALPVPVAGRFICNQATAAIDACAAGAGYGRFLSYMVAPLVKQGRLKIVLAEFEPPPVPVSLVYVQAKYMSARIRVLVDWMANGLRRQLAQQN